MPLNPRGSIRPDVRLSRLFVIAGWKIMYQLRADKRIKLLKASQGNEPEWYTTTRSTATSEPAGATTVPASDPQIKPYKNTQTDYLYTAAKEYEVPLIDVMTFARPAPIPMMQPRYSDKMGYTPMAPQKDPTLLSIEMPEVVFTKKTKKQKKVKPC
eukprot:jgi/Hompol1/1655/HPOL_001381-RA